jgi:hypothetical protein
MLHVKQRARARTHARAHDARMHRGGNEGTCLCQPDVALPAPCLETRSVTMGATGAHNRTLAASPRAPRCFCAGSSDASKPRALSWDANPGVAHHDGGLLTPREVVGQRARMRDRSGNKPHELQANHNMASSSGLREPRAGQRHDTQRKLDDSGECG